jgi:thymidylate synthase (FAD)
MIEVTYVDHMGSDLSVVNAARVSFGKKHTEFDTERDTKLIKYLAREKHYSPFNHTYVTFHVKAPLFVARQLVKHEYMPWNEISRRYVDEEPEFYTPDVWRGRSADKKQGSDGEIKIENYMPILISSNKCQINEATDFGNTWDVIEDTYDGVLALYDALIKMKVSPEQARMVLPQSMMTEWYWSGTMKAVHKMCSLRCKPDTQYESRIVAEAIDEKMMKLFPVSWEALRAYED